MESEWIDKLTSKQVKVVLYSYFFFFFGELFALLFAHTTEYFVYFYIILTPYLF